MCVKHPSGHYWTFSNNECKEWTKLQQTRISLLLLRNFTSKVSCYGFALLITLLPEENCSCQKSARPDKAATTSDNSDHSQQVSVK